MRELTVIDFHWCLPVSLEHMRTSWVLIVLTVTAFFTRWSLHCITCKICNTNIYLCLQKLEPCMKPVSNYFRIRFETVEYSRWNHNVNCRNQNQMKKWSSQWCSTQLKGCVQQARKWLFRPKFFSSSKWAQFLHVTLDLIGKRCPVIFSAVLFFVFEKFSSTSTGGKCALRWFYCLEKQKLSLERTPPGKNCVFAYVICGKWKRNQQT